MRVMLTSSRRLWSLVTCRGKDLAGRTWHGVLACQVIGLAVLSTAIGGCGRTANHGGGRFPSEYGLRQWHRYPIRYTRGGLQTLVAARMPGGHFAIVAKRYTYLGHIHSTLQVFAGGAGKHEKELGSSGPDIEATERTPLEINVVHGCDGTRGYALAYGMLREPKDAITAQANGHSIRFRKVAVPAAFKPAGVLVYALFATPGPTRVITRLVTGKPIRRELFEGLQSGYCRSR